MGNHLIKRERRATHLNASLLCLQSLLRLIMSLRLQRAENADAQDTQKAPTIRAGSVLEDELYIGAFN
eukprot:282230-Amphidinium_carterae.1